ncbi:hypothetical protein R3P38DRAFT_2880821 [Favolaschia claudopus]|uniref:Uncharacterized protein n=1 Tax=Favolaschia claudopus TaxID=2862362 RepID=A0AAW0D192_9AGAR
MSLCLGMPGGSWMPDEKDALECCEPEEEPTSSSRVAASIHESYTVHSEIVELDPTSLAEEVRLLASPRNTLKKETWRVRMSPEFGIETLDPDQHEPGSTLMPRRILDSPEQRRWRALHNVFPEIKDSLHSNSHGSSSSSSASSIADIEWDFQSNRPPPVIIDASDTVIKSESDEIQADLPIGGKPDTQGATSSSSSASSSSSQKGDGQDLPLPSSDNSVPDGEHNTTSSSPAPVTSVGFPSTARASSTPPAFDVPSSNDSDSGSDSSRPRDTDDELIQTPSSMADSAPFSGHEESESLTFNFIRPAASSIPSVDAEDTAARSPDHSDNAELEYLDDNPSTTPLSSLRIHNISLPLLLDTNRFLPSEWVVVTDPSTPDSFFGNVGPSSHTMESPLNLETIAIATARGAERSPSISERLLSNEPPSLQGVHREDAAYEEDDGEFEASVQAQSNPHWEHGTPELPPLRFHSPSLTDEVLGFADFPARDLQSFKSLDPKPLPRAGHGPTEHLRTRSTPFERQSILWTPHDRRYGVPDSGPRTDIKRKGKARQRAISVNSGVLVDQAVQTTAPTEVDQLKVRYTRLKKELRLEKQRVVELQQREQSKQREVDSNLLAKLFNWGIPIHYEDMVL